MSGVVLGVRIHGMNNYHGNGFVKPEPPPNAPLPSKKPEKPPSQILGGHSFSPSGLKKHSPKQNHILQQPGNPASQALLSVMPPGHGLAASPHMGMMNQAQNNLPARPHSASDGMYASVGSHGDQTLPYVAPQGQFVNHLPYSQPQPPPNTQSLPQPQVFYPGPYYFYYPQQ